MLKFVQFKQRGEKLPYVDDSGKEVILHVTLSNHMMAV